MANSSDFGDELLRVLNRYQPTDAVPGMLIVLQALATLVALYGPVLDEEDSSGFFAQLQERVEESSRRTTSSPARRRCSMDYVRLCRKLMVEAQATFLASVRGRTLLTHTRRTAMPEFEPFKKSRNNQPSN